MDIWIISVCYHHSNSLISLRNRHFLPFVITFQSKNLGVELWVGEMGLFSSPCALLACALTACAGSRVKRQLPLVRLSPSLSSVSSAVSSSLCLLSVKCRSCRPGIHTPQQRRNIHLLLSFYGFSFLVWNLICC